MENCRKDLGPQEISPGGQAELVAGSASPFNQDIGAAFGLLLAKNSA
jgi:hypothetical protein